jgi:hypothetical protein
MHATRKSFSKNYFTSGGRQVALRASLRLHLAFWLGLAWLGLNLVILHTYPPMKMEQTECSETLAYKIQTPRKAYNICQLHRKI